MKNENSWDYVIDSKKSFLFTSKIKEIIDSKDLIMTLVMRDLNAQYKQTLLGPLWFVLSPLISTLVYTFIFGTVAKISTDGIPPILFYLVGICLWRYSSSLIISTTMTFNLNKQLFSKVYFPRFVMPISFAISLLIKVAVQLVLVLAFYIYYSRGGFYKPNITILFFPFVFFFMALFSLGLGAIFSTFTTKYKDFNHLVGVFVQLLMYGSAVIFPLSYVPDEYKGLVALNPLVQFFEFFRYSIFSSGQLNYTGISITMIASLMTFIVGLKLFTRTEKNFIDSI
jgi:lipopolysaccharide transport system permease protein